MLEYPPVSQTATHGLFYFTKRKSKQEEKNLSTYIDSYFEKPLQKNDKDIFAYII